MKHGYAKTSGTLCTMESCCAEKQLQSLWEVRERMRDRCDHGRNDTNATKRPELIGTDCLVALSTTSYILTRPLWHHNLNSAL